METVVQVISKEILKPSSQTPHHLKNHELSVLDQLQPPVYIPLIFFYQANDEFNTTIDHNTYRAQISQKLKQSLSDTLTTFYPLAGRLDQENFSSVECNDAGVMYVESRVRARLSDAIQDPTKKQLKTYLPFSSAAVVDNISVGVQINFFDCGGIAIGSCVSHLIADAGSVVAFMNSWAAMCRGEVDRIARPSFDMANHFPQRNVYHNNITLSNLVMPEEELATKTIVFDKEKLKALRVAATSPESAIVKDPTRVELVSSFIWKHFVETAISKNNTSSSAVQAVSLRKRLMVDDDQHVFGNGSVKQIATFDHHDKGTIPEIHDLVSELREKFRQVNDHEYIRKFQSQDEDCYSETFDQLSKEGEEYTLFSSWCRFPVYEVDYGWGQPAWVGTTAFSLLNLTILMDNKSGDGIEAWINTRPEDMKALESKLKLLPNN